MDSFALYKEILSLSGLSSVLAPGVIRRALKDVGVDHAIAKAEDYRRALPKLEVRMRVYVPDQTARQRVESILTFLKGLNTDELR